MKIELVGGPRDGFIFESAVAALELRFPDKPPRGRSLLRREHDRPTALPTVVLYRRRLNDTADPLLYDYVPLEPA